MDPGAGGYFEWLRNWLGTHSENEHHRYERKDETFRVDFSKYSSLSELSLEVYNSIRSSDLSLDQLTAYINKLGMIISQSDLRAISSQPRSKMAKMFSVVYETGDLSSVFMECIGEHSHVYVYLMIRVLFEIVLYTKSTPVRSFAHAQIIKNRHKISALMALSYNPSNAPLYALVENSFFETTRASKHLNSTGNYHLPFDPEFSSEPYSVDLFANPVGEIGYPSSTVSQNVFENLLLEMLQSADLNLTCMGMQLLSVVPTVAAKSPPILSELHLFLVGDDDELSHLASLALTTIMPLLPELLALNFLKAAYGVALSTEYNTQRLRSFTLIALSCKDLRAARGYAYTMVWMVYLRLEKHNKLGEHAHAILTEHKLALTLTSTLLSAEDAGTLRRQEKRLQAMLNQNLNTLTVNTKADSATFELNRTNLLLVRGIIYSLLLIYFPQEPGAGLLDKLNDLTSVATNNTLNPNKYVNINMLTNGIDPLLHEKNNFFSFIHYGTCLKLLEYFEKNNLNTLFNRFLEVFSDSMAHSPENLTVLFTLKRCLRLVQNPCTLLNRIFSVIQGHVDGLEPALRLQVLRSLLEMVEYSFLTDLANFSSFRPKYSEKTPNTSLKLITRPFLQIQTINHESILSHQDILVHHLYSCVNNEVISDTLHLRPVVLDLGSHQVHVGESSLTVVVVRSKFSWGSEYSKILRKQIALNFLENQHKIEPCDQYKNLYKVAIFALRLGFHGEAVGLFRRLSFVSEDHYLWLAVLTKFAESNSVVLDHESPKKDLKEYVARYVGCARSILGLLRVLRNTSSLRMQQQQQKSWDYGLNYELPAPPLHTYVVLTLATRLGIADILTSIKDKNYDLNKFVKLFTSLKAAYKALEFLFRLRSSETVYVLSAYQALATVIVQVLKTLLASKTKGKRAPPSTEEQPDLRYFWTYLSQFSQNLDTPDILYVMDFLPRRTRASLLTNLLVTHKVPAKTKGEPEANPADRGSTPKFVVENKAFDMPYTSETVKVPLETIWLEVAGSLRLTAKNGHVYSFQRDVPGFNAIHKLLQPLSQGYSDAKFVAFLQAVLTAEVPTPVGVLKAYPLPFASLTATLVLQKRGELEVQTLQVCGNLRNCQDSTSIPYVSLRMEFRDMDQEEVLYERLKLVRNSVFETILIRIPQEVCKNGSFMAVPLDRRLIPRGIPNAVPLTHKFV